MTDVSGRKMENVLFNVLQLLLCYVSPPPPPPSPPLSLIRVLFLFKLIFTFYIFHIHTYITRISRAAQRDMKTNTTRPLYGSIRTYVYCSSRRLYTSSNGGRINVLRLPRVKTVEDDPLYIIVVRTNCVWKILYFDAAEIWKTR